MPVITKRLLDKVQPTGMLQIIRDDTLTGFGVQVTGSGTISFCITYTITGKSRRKVIGRFGPMTVEMARTKAQKLLGMAGEAIDPLAAEPTSFASVNNVFEAWMAQHVANHCKASTAEWYATVYNGNCRPRFGHIAPQALRRADIAKAHADMEATPTAANHMVRVLCAALSWAQTQELLTWPRGNPAEGHRLYPSNPGERFLAVPEIRTFIDALPTAPFSEDMGRILMLELLLLQRSGEIAAMRKAEVDLTTAVWSIPPTKNKGGRPHLVPLPPWSRDILQTAIAKAKGPFLFPSPRITPEARDAQPIDAHACATALRRAQRPADDNAISLPRPEDSIWVYDFRDAELRPNPVTPHDLRRTGSSYLELLGYSEAIRGAILNHSRQRSVTLRHYSAAELLRVKRTALLHWEATVRQIVAGDDPFATSLEDDRAEEARLLGSSKPPDRTTIDAGR
jgi:integrase